ncbi:Glycosyltransferase [Quillaja saponaria]|uniref:Glycosyltransferase n=1 Tax=Quillaja saponaria TaxID=32244 RepID=A0AAD7QCU3_QUISA|nr:Glycosyltransferase [Quillaja saponaria]
MSHKDLHIESSYHPSHFTRTAAATMVQPPHFLLITFPIQGHINPGLQFAKRLISTGAHVTFVTTVFAEKRMGKKQMPDGLFLTTFSDGYDDGYTDGDNIGKYLSELKKRGTKTVTDLILSAAKQGRPFTCVIYTPLLHWVAEEARELHLPSALLWIQPAIVFDIYYYYCKGYSEVIKSKAIDPSSSIELPGLPLLAIRDLPSFLVPSNINTNAYAFGLSSTQEQVQLLDNETNPIILVNTFDSLEPEALNSIDKFNLIAIGPLIPSAFLDGKDPSDNSFGGDLFHVSNDDYKQWLDLKAESSVIYVSFGSLSELSKKQKEEIARALLDTGRPFLWVIREKEKDKKENESEEEELSCRQELEQQGKIVKWCSQVEVLSHTSLGCFLTHCGWNSTMESLVSGVPVVAFPQWTDQATNAKLLEDLCKTGVRVEVNEEGIVESEEIKRCLELVMGSGERGEEMRNNAKKWKKLSREAVKEGGSSDKNLKCFVDKVSGGCS